jgi:RimJ/RimL family protein N-acetyltransferase
VAGRAPSPPRRGVVLRDVAESDLAVFYDHQLDPEATRMAAFPARDWKPFSAHWRRILGDETVITQTVLVDGRVAGNVVSWQGPGGRLVGYWIGRSFWGKGIATRALSAFLGQVEERPLFARVAKHNVASIRVLEKCGFTIAGEDGGSGAGGDDVEEFILKLEA